MFGGLFQIFIIFQHFYAPISFLIHCWGFYLCCAADAHITTMHILHIPHMKALRTQCIVSFHFTPHISPAFLWRLGSIYHNDAKYVFIQFLWVRLDNGNQFSYRAVVLRELKNYFVRIKWAVNEFQGKYDWLRVIVIVIII